MFIIAIIKAILAVLVGFMALIFAAVFLFDVTQKSAPLSKSKFTNERPTEQPLSKLFKFLATGRRGKWSDEPETVRQTIPPERVFEGIEVTFVNHATLLIQTAGFNILTDPIWSARCSPFSFAGPKRAKAPGVAFDDLPPIDAVIISHNHYDHLDLPTLQKLVARHNPKILVGLGNAAYLEKNGIFNSVDLSWWQSMALSSEIEATFVPAQHFSGRAFSDRDKTLWGGFVIETPRHKIYFAGDTGMGPQFEQIRGRFGPIDIAMLPIGAFRPDWMMKPVHISPAEAVLAAQILEAKVSIPIHYGTFRLALDGETEPLENLTDALKNQTNPPRFQVLNHGEALKESAYHQSGEYNRHHTPS